MTTLPIGACNLEQTRLTLQARLDAAKTQAERNRLGQFATPTTLARDIVQFGLQLFGTAQPVRFLDPAVGTGAFFSALLHTLPTALQNAQGFEIDPHYAIPAQVLWRETRLDLQQADFTRATPPRDEAARCNLLICNPPYVRHHHLANGEKTRLQTLTQKTFGIRITGLAGLYSYFLGLAHDWMQRGAVAGWLIPSEFMDVNYGAAIRHYLLHQVTLLRIHRFNPHDVQFGDALVSSVVVWLRNESPPTAHTVEFTYGGTLAAPQSANSVPIAVLQHETKWTRFPGAAVRTQTAQCRLADFFTIKRGIATGDNSFFILSRQEIDERKLPLSQFRPILPSPRYLADEEVVADATGLPLLEKSLFLLNCRLPEAEIQARYPTLWAYLESGRERVSARYLCRSRKAWYFQEDRAPAPLLCTYLGRSDTPRGRPFRFILNHSNAVAANVYLLLYPKPALAEALAQDAGLLRRIWEYLNALSPEALLGEGRVYGGGLHKLEPGELGNVKIKDFEIFYQNLLKSKDIKQMDFFNH